MTAELEIDRDTEAELGTGANPRGFIILAYNSNRKVMAIGSAYGELIKKEFTALRMINRLEKKHPQWDFILLPITNRKEWY